MASSPFRSRIKRDRLPLKSDLIWSIINSLTYLLMATLWLVKAHKGRQPCARRAGRSSGGRASRRNPDARAHGRRDRDRLEVRSLGRGRLERSQVVQESIDILNQLLFAEADLAHGDGHVAPLVVAKFDLAGLEFADGRDDVGRDGARPGRRHQSPGTEDAAQR